MGIGVPPLVTGRRQQRTRRVPWRPARFPGRRLRNWVGTAQAGLPTYWTRKTGMICRLWPAQLGLSLLRPRLHSIFWRSLMVPDGRGMPPTHRLAALLVALSRRIPRHGAWISRYDENRTEHDLYGAGRAVEGYSPACGCLLLTVCAVSCARWVHFEARRRPLETGGEICGGSARFLPLPSPTGSAPQHPLTDFAARRRAIPSCGI